MKDFYKPEEHGPTSEAPLDGRYCNLQGGYILCPALEKTEDGFDCRIFRGQLGVSAKNSLTGLMGRKLPVKVPSRADECREENSLIFLDVGRKGQIEPPEQPEEE